MTENNITRRKALKAILAVAGGVSASAFIPSKWLKPVVKFGVMPVHTHTSTSPKLLCHLIDQNASDNYWTDQTPGGPGDVTYGTFTITDMLLHEPTPAVGSTIKMAFQSTDVTLSGPTTGSATVVAEYQKNGNPLNLTPNQGVSYSGATKGVPFLITVTFTNVGVACWKLPCTMTNT